MSSENNKFIRNEETAEEIKRLAKTGMAEAYISVRVGISTKELRKHYREDLFLGRSDLWMDYSADILNSLTAHPAYLQFMGKILNPEVSETGIEVGNKEKITVVFK